MRTRKPNVTEKDFAIAKRLRAGGASTHEICELTGFSDSTIWNIDQCETFEDYMNRNIARRKNTVNKQVEKVDKPSPEQLTVDGVLQGTDQERIEQIHEMICEIGSTLAHIDSACTRMLVLLEVLAGGKR